MGDIIQVMCKISSFDPLLIIKHLTSEIVNETVSPSNDLIKKKVEKVCILSNVLKSLHSASNKNFKENSISTDIQNILSDICFPLLLHLQPSYDRGDETLTSVAVICELISNSLQNDNSDLIIFVFNQCDHFLDVWLSERPSILDHHHPKDECMDIICIVEILKTVFSVTKCQLEMWNTSKKNILLDSLFFKLLNVLSQVPHHVISRIMFGVFSPLLGQDPNEAVSRMGKLWATIQQLVGPEINRAVFLEQTLLILCSLADFFFPVTGVPVGDDLRHSSVFWKILQEAMIHINPLTRKRAMYLLKRIVDICDKQALEVCYEQCSEFCWKTTCQKELSKTWEDFVLVMETLEEKQVHVIKPLLGRVHFLLNATYLQNNVKCSLHTSWLVTIFRRCLMHESVFVVKWAVDLVLNLNYDIIPLLNQGQSEFLSGSFLLSFQELKIYTRPQGVPLGSAPFVGPGLIKFFSSCIRVLKDPASQNSFLKQIFNTILSTSWSSVPVMFFTQGLSHIPQSSLLDKEAVLCIKQIIVSKLTTMEPHAKGIVHCFLVQTLIHLIDQNNVGLEDFMNVISSFDGELSLQRGTTQWQEVLKWMETSSSWSRQFVGQTVMSLVQEYLQVKEESEINMADKIKVSQISRLLLLAADAGFLENFDDILSFITVVINSVNTHVYMPKVKADKAIYLLAAVSKEQGKVKQTQVDSSIQAAFASCQKELYDYIASRVNGDVTQMSDLSLVNMYTDMLDIFNKYKNYDKAWYSQTLLQLCTKCIKTLNVADRMTKKSQQHQMLQAALVSVLSTVGQLIDDQDGTNNYRSVTYCIIDYVSVMKLDTSFTKGFAIDDGTGNGKKNWGKVVSLFMTSQWQLLHFWLKRHPEIKAESLFYKCLDAFDTGSWESDLPVTDCLACLLPQLVTSDVKPEQIMVAIDLAWMKTNEEHHTAGFWLKLRSFVNMAFQKPFLKLPADSVIFQHLLKYTQILSTFGDDKAGVFNLLVERLCQVWSSQDGILIANKFIPVIADACLFGEVIKKADNLFSDVWAHFETLQNSVSVNQILPGLKRSSLVVRTMIVDFLTRLKPEDKSHCELVIGLWRELMQRYQLLMDESVYRQYNNSLSHRRKHRIFQTLLVFEPFISERYRVECWSFIWKSLVTEVHPSVRHMQEWLILRLALRFPSFTEDLFMYFQEFSEKKNLSLTSLITVVSHLGPHLPKPLQSGYYMKAIPLVIPWCMAHHFNTRLHAQVTIIKLWEQCTSLELHDVTTAYSIVNTFLCFSTENSNTMKNVQKLFDNYFMKTFHFIQDYSIETIFNTLPMLALLSDEEWIPPEMFDDDEVIPKTEQSFRHLPLYNINSDLKMCTAGPWRIKPPAEANDDCDEGGEGDVQKKIMPWRLMTPDEESVDYEFKKKHHKPGGLVVVTSLIDKIPNLGGLCRSSEIFGVSEFVLANLRCTGDKVFQVLSVTAQNWIPITEVPPERLMEFMEDKRKEGYTLIGAEQTANSVCLTNYRFPTKSLLLLGNEKEGIPVNLIQLLDVCVEIPQVGIIRSLNVHVSGALLIWEYARQQMEKSSGS